MGEWPRRAGKHAQRFDARPMMVYLRKVSRERMHGAQPRVETGGESMTKTTGTTILLLASFLIVCCCSASLASGIPASIAGPPGLDGSTALFTSPSFTPSDTATDTSLDLVALASPSVNMGIGEGGTGTAAEESKPSGQKWLSSLGYAAAAAGLAVGLGSSGGGSGGGGTRGPGTKQPTDEPVPEPSTLILAALAASSALGVLRRRKNS